jgi:putative hydrolase of the HAD superfamily
MGTSCPNRDSSPTPPASGKSQLMACEICGHGAPLRMLAQKPARRYLNPMPANTITTLFLDIGGVLLTNGWDTALRRKTADHFGVDYGELDHRHNVTYDTYESGKSSLDQYLAQILFHQPREFTPHDVARFILEEARPHTETIDLIKKLRAVYGLRVAVVSNEGREIAGDRIHRFHLGEFVDFFIVSAFVHFRKPDPDIYRLALDVAQVHPGQVAYIEDRPLLCEVATSLGMHAVLHHNPEETRDALARLGLTL